MDILERKIDALLDLGGLNNGRDRQAVRQGIVNILHAAQPRDYEPRVRGLLLELGAPDHLLGHQYMVHAICLALEDERFLHSLTYALYPRVAASFDTTAHRVERSLRTLVETTWLRGDPEILNRYFGNTLSAHKGKPTCGEFIARCVNILKLQ